MYQSLHFEAGAVQESLLKILFPAVKLLAQGHGAREWQCRVKMQAAWLQSP